MAHRMGGIASGARPRPWSLAVKLAPTRCPMPGEGPRVPYESPGLSLALFTPGLFDLPAPEPPEALLGDLRLRALERLLVRADAAPGTAGGPEAALLRLFGHDLAGDAVPAAPLTRLVDEPVAWSGNAPAFPLSGAVGAGAGWWLRADPVHLRPDLASVLLFDAGTFDLAEAEAVALAREVAPLFAAVGARLEVGSPDRWYLRLASPLEMRASPLSAVIGQDLRDHRPQGPDAPRWQTLLTEVQMTLFASPVNRAREARGELPVNSLWLWGGGRLPSPPVRRWAAVWGGDPLAGGLARLAGSACGPLPESAEAWLSSEPLRSPVVSGRGRLGEAHVAVDLGLWRAARYGDVDGWRAGLAALEERWIAPLLAALGERRLDAVSVADGAGRQLRLTRRGLRKWWRRSLPLAAHYARATRG